MSDSPPPIIQALLEPWRYPEPAANVELMETHASWVLLAGDFAYKIKKPITLPFLDYGTLARRLACCQIELRLNRRFTSDLYLGLIEISGTPEQPIIGALNQATGNAIEYAVKMKRFDESARLDHVCSRGELIPDQISQLANAIINFHQIAAIAPTMSRFGSAEILLAPALENINTLRALLPTPADRHQLEQLESWTQSEHKHLIPQFTARKAEGRIRECHGDLHLGNLVIINNQVTLFDCIEFNEEFRWIDVASEITFPYIDLLDHNQPGLACWLLNQWLSSSGDYGSVPLLRFYATYRALVRAKVSAILAAQHEKDFSTARVYLALARKLAIPHKPCLTITHGLAGCGKTTAAKLQLLTDKDGATLCLRSDVERKRLFDLTENASSNSSLREGIYNPNATRLTYHRLLNLTTQLLNAGWSVIVDAAFLLHEERDNFRRLAEQSGIDFFILAPQATDDQMMERIRLRLEEGRDASEATQDVLKMQQKIIEPLDSHEREYIRKADGEVAEGIRTKVI